MLQRKFPAANFLLGLFYRHGSRKFTEWMSHRKQKDTKQQPGTAGHGNILGCCLVSFSFLCDIDSIHSVLSPHNMFNLQMEDL